MRHNFSVLPAPAAALLGATAAPAAASTDRVGEFQAHVRTGPDGDLSLVGRLNVHIANSGRITGRLVQREGERRIRVARVSGRAADRTLRLRFRTRSAKRIVGRAERAIERRADLPRTGNLNGPRRGDRGERGYALGG
jgi:hypothetical protein